MVLMTTYVLGAGASLHAGYPLLADLPYALKAWAERTRLPEASHIAWLCTRIASDPADRGSTNFEQLLTDLEAAGPQKVTLPDGDWFYPLLLVEGLPLLISNFFDGLRGKSDASAYRKFATCVIEPGDAVITFNYDVALEKELAAVGKWHIGTGYGFPIFLEKSTVCVLKLHGSTNWKSVTDGTLGPSTFNVDDPHGSRPMILDHDLQWLGFGGLKDPLLTQGRPVLGGAPQHTFLLPKTYKEFPGRMWSYLWEQAKSVLKGSSRVAIAGYSLPEADEKARNLILGECSRSARIVLRCKAKTHALAGEFKAAGFSNVDADDKQDFEAWVNEAAGRSGAKAAGESISASNATCS